MAIDSDGASSAGAPLAEFAPGGADAPPSSDNELVGSGPAGLAPPLENLPEFVLGVPLRRIKCRNDKTWQYQSRVAVSCTHHDGCSKTRSVQLGVAERSRRLSRHMVAKGGEHGGGGS